MTAPLKQDPASQQVLAEFRRTFATEIQPVMEAALRESRLVHFARVLLIGEPPRYLQVLTEFDGDPIDYTDFFRLKLTEIFKQVFTLVEGAPDWEQLNTRVGFFEFCQKINPEALGTNVSRDPNRGYLFSAYGDRTVEDILDALGAG